MQLAMRCHAAWPCAAAKFPLHEGRKTKRVGEGGRCVAHHSFVLLCSKWRGFDDKENSTVFFLGEH